MDLLWFLLIGALIGWLAGVIMKGRGFGLLGNIAVGVVGSFLGGFLFRLLGVTWGGLLGSIGTALVGALLLVWIAGLIRKA